MGSCLCLEKHKRTLEEQRVLLGNSLLRCSNLTDLFLTGAFVLCGNCLVFFGGGGVVGILKPCDVIISTTRQGN